jgi:RimJ/RimL family protein N-acetyltransferase
MRRDPRLFLVKIKSVLDLIAPVTIWGERVGLRSIKSPLTDAEVEQIYGWSCDEEVLRWSGGAKSGLSLESFRDQIHRTRWKRQEDQCLFYIVTKEEGIIGRVGLYTINWAKREGEFGISIDKRHWNKRYGREATELLLRYIFGHTPVERIHLGTFQDNVRAQHSFIASGFRVIGKVSRFLPSEGREVDGIEMEITAQDLKNHLLRVTK